ncbi:hypothetical protein [Actinoplanes derwentensis]|nr:hypothetical protein [Actinoplanes derwentensis]
MRFDSHPNSPRYGCSLGMTIAFRADTIKVRERVIAAMAKMPWLVTDG